MSVVANLSEKPGFLFVGEHPALDFVNTRYAPQGTLVDTLREWSDLTAWLKKAGLPSHATETKGALTAVRDLRDAWHAQVERLAGGRKLQPAFLKLLNGHLATDHFADVLGDAKGFRLHRTPSTLTGGPFVLALLARQIAEFLATTNLRHLRKCADHACVLYFSDTTKNHRRQWCSVATCGNRHKVAAFRRRQAQGG